MIFFVFRVTLPNFLAEIQTRASEYVDLKNKDKESPEAMLISLNLGNLFDFLSSFPTLFNLKCDYSFLFIFIDTEEFGELLTSQIARALPANGKNPERLWLTAHTGTLIKSLAQIWPETNFMPVTVSKKLWEVCVFFVLLTFSFSHFSMILVQTFGIEWAGQKGLLFFILFCSPINFLKTLELNYLLLPKSLFNLSLKLAFLLILVY